MFPETTLGETQVYIAAAVQCRIHNGRVRLKSMKARALSLRSDSGPCEGRVPLCFGLVAFLCPGRNKT